MRAAFLVIAAMSLSAGTCDAIYVEHFTIEGAARLGPDGQATEDLKEVRRLLTTTGLGSMGESADAEEWEWRDPDNPPGVRVYITQEDSAVKLQLSQDPFGPISRTEKYKAVRSALLTGLTGYFGDARVRVE